MTYYWLVWQRNILNSPSSKFNFTSNSKCQITSVSLPNIWLTGLILPLEIASRDSQTWQNIHQSSKSVSLPAEGNTWALRASCCAALLLRDSNKTRIPLFELEMTSHPNSNIKDTHHCLLMDDKVWINTCARVRARARTHKYTLTRISAYTCHDGDKAAYDNSRSDRGNLLLGIPADGPALVLDMHRLHPPSVGHLLLSLCPTGDLGEKATFRPDPPPGEPGW